MSSSADITKEVVFSSLAGSRSLSVRQIKPENPSSLTFFLVHGSMASKSQYDDLIRRLTSLPANIIAFDALGCGESSKPHVTDDYSTPNMVAELIQVFDKYATRKNILIGHSYGTSQIARLCGQYLQTSVQAGKDVVGVVLISTTLSIPDGGSPIFRLPLFALNLLSSYLRNQFAAIAFSPKTGPEVREKSRTLSAANDMFVAQAFYRQFKWATLAEWESLNYYPLLCIQGEDDKLTPVDGAVKLVNEVFQSSSRQDPNDLTFKVVKDAGHLIILEKPDEIFEIIIEFLEENEIVQQQHRIEIKD